VTRALAAFFGALRLSLRRTRAALGLTAAVIVAMAGLAGVWMAVPLFSEPAAAQLLTEQIASDDRTPFGYLYSFNRLSSSTKTMGELEGVSAVLGGAESDFGATILDARRLVETRGFQIFRTIAVGAGDPNDRLETLPFTTSNNLNEMTFIQGRAPEPARDPGIPIEVAISATLAESLGVDVGEALTAINSRRSPDTQEWATDVIVVGLWEPPTVAAPAARFVQSGQMVRSLVVPEQTFLATVDNLDPAVVSAAQWLVLLDPARITTDQVDALVARTRGINRLVNDRLPGTRLLMDPEDALGGFQLQANRLESGLRMFSLPAVLLSIVVVAVLVSMRWNRSAAERELLDRHGVRRGPLLVAAAIESILTTIVAIAFGVLIGRGIANIIGRTDTFLRLGDGLHLPLVNNRRTWRALLLAALVIFILHFAPPLWNTIVSRFDRRRDASGPRLAWWHRSRADLVIVGAIGFFGWFVLQSDAVSGDLLDDPVVVLLPTALGLAAGLLTMRAYPIGMSLLARALQRTPSTALLAAARRGARASGYALAPVLLIVLTGSLTIYTASLARTLDLHLVDQAHHLVGAENAIRDVGGLTPTGSGFGLPSPEPGPSVDPSSFERVWALDGATRMLQLPGRASGIAGGSPIPIEFTVVDPRTFANAAFWREDYSTQSLTQLMATLSATPDGVLAHRPLLRANGLRVGDMITVAVSDGSDGINIPMVIVGHFDQFPGWSPSSDLRPLVASLPDYEQRIGRTVSSQVLFERPGTIVDNAQTVADLSRLGITATRVASASELIERAQNRPERKGVFGVLTASFVVFSTLTAAGFIAYAVFGFARQRTQLGVLRAFGLRRRHLLVIVGMDLLGIAVAGVGMATLTGIAMSTFVLPEMIGARAGSAPRVLPVIDWLATATIGAALLVAFVILSAILISSIGRLRLFEAVKVGATE